MRIPRGIRAKNPGNIELSQKFTWQGEVRPSLDDRFCTFVEPVWGVRAMMKLLINYNQKVGLQTLADAIHRYAPSNENHTQNYINTVASWADIDPLKDWDFTDRVFLVPVVKAMVRFENGSPSQTEIEEGAEPYWWYSNKVYEEAYQLAIKGRITSHTFNELQEDDKWTEKTSLNQKHSGSTLSLLSVAFLVLKSWVLRLVRK